MTTAVEINNNNNVLHPNTTTTETDPTRAGYRKPIEIAHFETRLSQQKQLVQEKLRHLVLPQNVTKGETITIARRSFNPLNHVQTAYEPRLFSAAGLSEVDYVRFMDTIGSDIEDYKNTANRAYDCALAGTALFLVLPVAITLMITSNGLFEESVEKLVYTVEKIKAEAAKLRLNDGVRIVIGLNEAEFNATFASPGTLAKNFYFQELDILLEYPVNRAPSAVFQQIRQ